MTCSTCGHRVGDEDRYCSRCGAPRRSREASLGEDESPPPPVAGLRDEHPGPWTALEGRMRRLEARIPQTRLLHPRFLPRSFAVFGHYVVAGLIVSFPFLVLLGLLYVLVFIAEGRP